MYFIKRRRDDQEQTSIQRNDGKIPEVVEEI